MAVLTPPTAELVERLKQAVPYERRLVGFTMTQMAGNVEQPLYTFEQAANFLQAAPAERLLNVGGKPSLTYVDPGALVRWLEEVFGDAELAGAVREAAETSENYVESVHLFKALLQERLGQCLAFEEEMAAGHGK